MKSTKIQLTTQKSKQTIWLILPFILLLLTVNLTAQTRNLVVEGNGDQMGVIHSLDTNSTGIELLRGDQSAGTDWRVINQNGVLRFQSQTDNFSMGGINRFSLNEDGFFGLGCTNPQAKLSICNGQIAFNNAFSESAADKISLDGYSFGQPHMVGLGYETSLVAQPGGGITEFSDLYFKAEGSHRWYTNSNADIGASASMVLDRDGQLGLGTNSPDGKLEIHHNTTMGNPHLRLTEPGTESGRMEFRNTTNPDRFSYIVSDPGATNPSMGLGYNDGSGSKRLLDLQFGDDEVVLDGTLRLENNNNTYAISVGGDGDLDFVGDGATRMTIRDNNGNVGIGTENPLARLHIEGSTDASLTGNGYFIMGSTTSHNMVLDNNEIIARNNGAASNLLLQANGGNVGIGTNSPAAELHISNIGDAELLLEADTNNNNEADHPKLKFRQDGGLVTGEMGYHSSSNDLRVINNTGGAAIILKSNGDIIIGKQ